jgi:hypothetical protein
VGIFCLDSYVGLGPERASNNRNRTAPFAIKQSKPA